MKKCVHNSLLQTVSLTFTFAGHSVFVVQSGYTT